MIYIAHRGLTDGPDETIENSPAQIKKALSEGFDCEIDVWKIQDEWFLGHDKPEYLIPFMFLTNPRLWAHCKNVEALEHCPNINKFWHDTDSYTLTENGYIWAYPGKPLTRSSISVLPERYLPSGVAEEGTYSGVCSDYVRLLRDGPR